MKLQETDNEGSEQDGHSIGWDFCENKDCPRKRNQKHSLEHINIFPTCNSA